MAVLTTDPARAAQTLLAGQAVALPTETVYGLGALVGVPGAVERIFTIKDRPVGHPLIVHIADADALAAWAVDVPAYAQQLATAYWPGPLTLVLRRSGRVPDVVTGGRDTVAIRVPAHPVMQQVLRALDVTDAAGAPHGVAAPSANRHGRVSPTAAEHVVADLGAYLDADDAVLDGGACTVGVESTIVDCTATVPVLLRPGSIGPDDIARVTATAVEIAGADPQPGEAWPGGLASHYAPQAQVRVVAEDALADTARAAAGAEPGRRVGVIAPAQVPTPATCVRLAAPTTDADYAAQLYAALRGADEQRLGQVLAVAPTGASGIARAVRDRLCRAATAPAGAGQAEAGHSDAGQAEAGQAEAGHSDAGQR